MTQDAKVQIGLSTDFLEGTSVDTPAGNSLFREGVVLSDPDDAQGRANVRQLGTQLLAADKGIVTNTVIHGLTTAGHGAYVDVKVNPSGALAVDASGSTVIDAKQSGVWGYKSGVSGTPTIPANAKILQITAASVVGGSLTINGGDTVTLPPNGSISIEPKGNLVTPTVVFTNTSAYFVEYVV